ncbi:methionine adenosyltransferase [Streptomyces silvisoli]|uniref:Methionine adenosyltransferase n=1 Tax=Streptomyces silvisoli TaxID=3034235 RepID=A0ABT5ZKD8_9ACTN|nr:methionine adenosyltransferase [Streptomyces silvisoli]MDF3290299.1 methionine adenosyltransferase [Streptomyces silvisoli]
MTNTALDYLSIHQDRSAGIEALPYELVERKGEGHPDTMCDAIAERASSYYARYCMEQFGRVAHHWFDKVMIYGGEADIDYGRGELTRPYTVLFSGKGAYAFGGTPIPLPDILYQATADTLAAVTTGFIAEKHLKLQCEIVDHQGAGRGRSRYRPQTLDDLVQIGDPRLVSNDCNLLHGYAPFSRLERVVLDVEQLVNGSDFKATNPDTGWDVKVFGSRRDGRFRLIVNMPFLGARIESLDHYFARKAECSARIREFAESVVECPVDLLVNPTDRNGRPYLTALGSVADTGDVGVVGRGNRLNGLITPMRSMSIEAPAGKNPLDHTGKLYGILAHRLAAQIHQAIGVPVETHIFTSKEAPLDQPDEVVVRLRNWQRADGDEQAVTRIVRDSLRSMGDVTRELVFTGITMW